MSGASGHMPSGHVRSHYGDAVQEKLNKSSVRTCHILKSGFFAGGYTRGLCTTTQIFIYILCVPLHKHTLLCWPYMITLSCSQYIHIRIPVMPQMS